MRGLVRRQPVELVRSFHHMRMFVCLVDLREYYEDASSGEQKPGKKGWGLSVIVGLCHRIANNGILTGISLTPAQYSVLSQQADWVAEKVPLVP